MPRLPDTIYCLQNRSERIFYTYEPFLQAKVAQAWTTPEAAAQFAREALGGVPGKYGVTCIVPRDTALLDWKFVNVDEDALYVLTSPERKGDYTRVEIIP